MLRFVPVLTAAGGQDGYMALSVTEAFLEVVTSALVEEV